MSAANGINWDYLDESSLHTLEVLGVLRRPMGIEFSRALSRAELLTVYFCLLRLEAGLKNTGNDQINFAIGDCLVAVSEWFGEQNVKPFAEEADRIRKARDFLFRLAGESMQYLQFLERTILTCCAAMELKGTRLTLADVLSEDSKRGRITLGKLKDHLIETRAFNGEFEERFEKFVESRNRFIHRLWLERGLEAPNIEVLEHLISFVLDLISEARFMDQVFKGLYASMLAARIKNNPQLSKHIGPEIRWTNLIPVFESVLRTPV